VATDGVAVNPCLASSTVMVLSAAFCSSSVIASGIPLASPALRAVGRPSLLNPSFRTYRVHTRPGEVLAATAT
jgi:hypothetical protein